MNRNLSFVALLVVVGLSVITGMAVADRFEPSPSRADRQAVARAIELVSAPALPAPVASAGRVDFADIVEGSIAGVVGVRNTSIPGEDPHEELRDNPFFERFFGPRDAPPPQQRRPSVGFGSGFIISPDGYVLTNNHVVESATRLEVALHSGQTFPAEVIGSDPTTDLALLKISPGDTDLHVLPLGDSKDLRVGEWVIAIGNPLGLEYSVTVGVVSAKARNVSIGTTVPGVASFIQTDAAINKGNSGGPLLDSAGRVIGINTAIMRGDFLERLAEGIGFALPIDVARDAVEQILQTGRVERGFLGIHMNQSSLDHVAQDYLGLPDANGVLISRVEEGMPADRAGLRSGDIIRKVDGEAIRDSNDLLAKIATRRPGETVALEIFRDRKYREFEVTLMSRDEGLTGVFGSAEESSPAPSETPRGSGLGIEVEALTPSTREERGLPAGIEGVVITEVDPASEAAEKGLSPPMVIASLNDRGLADVDDWNRMMDELEPGTPVKLEIVAVNPRGEVVPRFEFLVVPAD